MLWGFLRDAHGGVIAAQEVCRYARKRLVGGVALAEEYAIFLARREAGQMTAADEKRLVEILGYFMTATEQGADWHTYRRWRWLSTYHSPDHVTDGTAALLPYGVSSNKINLFLSQKVTFVTESCDKLHYFSRPSKFILLFER